jgi:hypothetical protein
MRPKATGGSGISPLCLLLDLRHVLVNALDLGLCFDKCLPACHFSLSSRYTNSRFFRSPSTVSVSLEQTCSSSFTVLAFVTSLAGTCIPSPLLLAAVRRGSIPGRPSVDAGVYKYKGGMRELHSQYNGERDGYGILQTITVWRSVRAPSYQCRPSYPARRWHWPSPDSSRRRARRCRGVRWCAAA